MTSQTSQIVVHELGVPVRSLNWVRLFPGRAADGRPQLLASMGQHTGGLFVCDIDLETGHCTQYPCALPGETSPTAAFRSPTTGILYVGGHSLGHLHRFDPNLPPDQRKLEDLGSIHPELCRFPCRIDEAPDGTIWIGASPGCSLTRFDPKNMDFKRFGRMDEVDLYFYPFCGADGTIAGVVKVCRLHVVTIDPATGEHRRVGPSIDKNDLSSTPGASKLFNLFKGIDGLLYLESAHGNFRICRMEAIPVDKVPEPMPAPTLSDGSKVEMTDLSSAIYRTVRVTPSNGASRTLRLDWQGGGTALFLIHEGPDGRVYGSSVLPEHLFVCDLDGRNMEDLGQCSVSAGEAYSMGNLGDKLYIASYPANRLSVYDPRKPIRFGTEPDANPRDLGRMDEVAYRPRSMLCGPAGKVWVASLPDYGMWGGTLAWYDPQSGRFGSHRHIVQDCSPFCLEWIPEIGQILVATTINGGTGTKPRASESRFVLWDPQRDQAAWVGDLGFSGLTGCRALCRSADGTVYALVETRAIDKEGNPQPNPIELVRIDFRSGQGCVVERSPFPGDNGGPLEVGLCRSPSKSVFGATRRALFRIIPGTIRIEFFWKNPEANIRVAGPIIGSTFYFASAHRLRSVEIPPPA